MRIYLATSWRNPYYAATLKILLDDGHSVYDFRHEGFAWSEIDPKWKTWTVQQYIDALRTERANAGFERDMKALDACDCCVYMMPCGVSASLEAGWAKGAGKLLAVYIPELQHPDLMVKMADLVTQDIVTLRKWLEAHSDLL